MITRLRLTNFQSWDSLDLALSGVVVLVGETNQGKSAILRALYAVLYNGLEGATFVRKGATLASVEVTTDDGHVVRLEKGVGVNRYILDGTVFDKIGRGVPPEVQEALGVAPVSFDDTTFLTLQFQGQMDAPFLLADQGVKATRLLGSVSQAATLYQAARVSSTQKKAAMAAQTAQATVVTDAEGRVASYAYVARAEPLAGALASLLERLRVLQDQYDAIVTRKARYEAAARTCTRLQLTRPRTESLMRLHQQRVALIEHSQWLRDHMTRRVQAQETLARLGERGQQLRARVVTAESLVRRYERQQALGQERAVVQRYTDARVRLAALTYNHGARHAAVTGALQYLREAEQLYTCPACGKDQGAAE